MAALQFARIKDNDANFRCLARWLGRDPIYGAVPLKRIAFIEQWLQSGRLLAAVRDGQLLGACGWTHLGTPVALKAIERREFPGQEDLDPLGSEIMISMLTGSEPGVVSRLIRAFVEVQRGKIILFERHRSRGQDCQRFGWIDRAGRLGGNALT